MSNEFWNEVFALVEQYDQQRPILIKEYRLYYNIDGTIIGLWETGHPQGHNYIVLEDPDIYHRNNTNLMRVKDGKLIILDPKQPHRTKLVKKDFGFRVVRGKASLPLADAEVYNDVEYYDRTNS